MNRAHIAVQLRAIAAHTEYLEERVIREPPTGTADKYWLAMVKLETLETITHLRELLDSIERELNRP